MTTKRFELSLENLDTDGETFDESDLQDLQAISQELGDLPPTEDVDFSDFEALLKEEEDEEKEEEEPAQEVEEVAEEPQIAEEPSKTELQSTVTESALKVEEPVVEATVQQTAIEELRQLLPQAKQTILKAPAAKPVAKVATKPAQSAKPMRYPTLMLYVTEAVADWIHNNESEDVDNYLKKKLQQANGARTVKVGPTKIRVNDMNTGDFVWTLKGKVYAQVAKFNAAEDRWELAEH